MTNKNDRYQKKSGFFNLLKDAFDENLILLELNKLIEEYGINFFINKDDSWIGFNNLSSMINKKPISLKHGRNTYTFHDCHVRADKYFCTGNAILVHAKAEKKLIPFSFCHVTIYLRQKPGGKIIVLHRYYNRHFKHIVSCSKLYPNQAALTEQNHTRYVNFSESEMCRFTDFIDPTINTFFNRLNQIHKNYCRELKQNIETLETHLNSIMCA